VASSAHDLQLRELKDEIKQLNISITTLTKLLSESSAREAEKDQIIANLQEQITFLTKKLFGASSERREDVSGQLNLFDEAECEFNPDMPDELLETTVKEHTRKSKSTNEDRFKGIPMEEKVITLPEDQRICENCGTTLVPIGKEYVRTELEFVPAKVKAIKYYRETYVCPTCKESGDPEVNAFVKAIVPEPLINNSPASPSTVAWTMYQKYVNALPLYRQESDWKQYGYIASRGTLANWIIRCANDYFKPMYEYFHRELLSRKFLMADETPVQVLHEPGRRAETKSYMWLFRSGEDGEAPIILYGYTPTRAGYNATDFLKGFKGYLECDGYQGYNAVPDIKRCCCWAHVRRYFIDAVPKGKQYDYSNPAVQGVQFCNKLFEYERLFKEKNYSFDKIKEMRQEKEKPILEAFFAWLDAQKPIKNSRLDKAITYTKNRRQYLDTYLEDGRCSFSNNASENSIRPFTVGRKNWLFSDTQQGAEASAMIYSIVEIAKENNLNVFDYLKYLLEKRPSMDMSDEELSQFSPWNEEVQELCKTK